MSHNITVESGKSIRLLTSGKYCDRDIIVTATGGGSDDSIVGTWVFKDEPTFEGIAYNVPYYFNFSLASGQSYSSIEFSNQEYGVSANFILYCNEGSSSTAYASQPAAWLSGGWDSPDYKTITILEEPTDEEFITWLRANAVKQAQPTAYTVSSFDELPSDAVDGSMAIVSLSSNRWLLNETITPFADEEPHQMLFECNGVIYKAIKYGIFGPPAYTLQYLNGGGDISVYGFEGSSSFGFKEGWSETFYRYISVYQADQEATNWLNSNGELRIENFDTKQFFYARENGEWVYKCEVV